MARLNDTTALSRQGIRKAGFETADEPFHVLPAAAASADAAVCGPQPGKFRRETGAGNESLAEATKCMEYC